MVKFYNDSVMIQAVTFAYLIVDELLVSIWSQLYTDIANFCRSLCMPATIIVLVLVVIPAPRGASKVQALALRAALTFFGITVKLKKLIGLIAITIN